MKLKLLFRRFIRFLFELSSQESAPRYTDAMSSAPTHSAVVVDDVTHAFDRKRLAYNIRATAAAERLVERGWDWDSKVPDALFFGQTEKAGPAEARARLTEADGGLQRAADMFNV